MKLTNYHTHHDRCKHAKGGVEAYVREAVLHHYDEIGMSCHTPHRNFKQLGTRRVMMNYQIILMILNKLKKSIPRSAF